MKSISVVKLINAQGIIFVIIFLLDQTLKEKGQKKGLTSGAHAVSITIVSGHLTRMSFVKKILIL